MARPFAILGFVLCLVAGALLGRAFLDRPLDAFATRTDLVMAAPITVVAPRGRIDEAAATVFDVFRGVDERMSEWKPSSPLSAVNDAAGERPVAVPDDLRAVVRRGLEIGAMTDGAFDVTWAALWGLWDFTAADPTVPDDAAIAARTALVDFRRVVIDDEAGTVFLPEPGMMIGLGGIAKGLALDEAARALRARGIDDFLVTAGGQTITGGTRDGRPWRIGVRDPRGARDDVFTVLEATDTSIATSGDYERFFIRDGVRYHHVLDPRTGRPARGVRSVTVVCADATLADALATACIVLGVEPALALVERTDDVEVLLVDHAARVHRSAGLAVGVEIRHAPAVE